jgi:hypothetical protein
MIDSYKFGTIVVDGKKYKKDIIVFPDKIIPDWRRKTGHLLIEDDVKEILNYNPYVLIIGTGASGLMKVDDSLKIKIKNSGIDLIIKKTPEAVAAYNKISSIKKTVFALHLTC